MLEFRPHHFLCTLGFEGKGYSDEFVRGYTKIAKELRETPHGNEVKIKVIQGSDSICSPCPNRNGEQCTTEAKIASLDLAHGAITGLTPGVETTWGEAKKIIAEKFTIQDHHHACAPCAWRSLGVCEAALKRLKGLK